MCAQMCRYKPILRSGDAAGRGTFGMLKDIDGVPAKDEEGNYIYSAGAGTLLLSIFSCLTCLQDHFMLCGQYWLHSSCFDGVF